MKVLVFFHIAFWIIFNVNTVFSQPKWWRDKHPHVVYYEGKLLDTLKTKLTSTQRAQINQTERITELEEENFLFSGLGVWNLGVRIEDSGQFYEGRNENIGTYFFPSILIREQSSVEIIAQNVNESNADDYLFRVIKNNEEELVSWTTPTVFRKTKEGRFQYAYLGHFNYAPEQLLKIEIYNKRQYRYQDAIILDWRAPHVPKLKAQVGYIKNSKAGEEELFHSSIDLQSAKDEKKLEELNQHDFEDFLSYSPTEDFRIRLDNSIKFLHFTIETFDRPYNYQTVLVRNYKSRQDTLDLGQVDRSFNLYREFWKSPGKYQLIIKPFVRTYGGQSIVPLVEISKTIHFTVLPENELAKSISFGTFMVVMLGILAILLIVFVLYRRYHKKQLESVEKKRLVATSRLQAIRAKLNPHFVFNALSSIQNLIGKKEIEKADSYLLRFSRIVRNVLDESAEPKLVSLREEINLMKDYLEMEKLRNDFSFEFVIDPSDVDLEIEIPDMLLQPYIENAVKHAVPQKNGDGKVEIVINQSGNDIFLKVMDNGRWTPNEGTNGKGLKLSKNHIDYLNLLYRESKISTDIVNEDDGSAVIITLKIGYEHEGYIGSR